MEECFLFTRVHTEVRGLSLGFYGVKSSCFVGHVSHQKNHIFVSLFFSLY